MSLFSRKLPPVLEPTKFRRFGEGQVLDAVESGLMYSQQSFEDLRRAGADQAPLHLDRLRVELTNALTGVEELIHRSQ